MTPEQRATKMRKAAQARWAKQKELAQEITEGTKALLKKAQQKKQKASA
jgi:hypothetical protein